MFAPVRPMITSNATAPGGELRDGLVGRVVRRDLHLPAGQLLELLDHARVDVVGVVVDPERALLVGTRRGSARCRRDRPRDGVVGRGSGRPPGRPASDDEVESRPPRRRRSAWSCSRSRRAARARRPELRRALQQPAAADARSSLDAPSAAIQCGLTVESSPYDRGRAREADRDQVARRRRVPAREQRGLRDVPRGVPDELAEQVLEGSATLGLRARAGRNQLPRELTRTTTRSSCGVPSTGSATRASPCGRRSGRCRRSRGRGRGGARRARPATGGRAP